MLFAEKCRKEELLLNPKPTVLHLIDSFREGGSERQALQLARLMGKRGAYSVRVATLNADGPLRYELGDAAVGELEVFSLDRFYDLNAARQLQRLAERIASRRESAKKAAIKRRLERIAYRAATRVIVNCDEVRSQLLAEGVSARKIVTLYNGLNLERTRISDGVTFAMALEKLGLSNIGTGKFVTIVANFRDIKDHATFLRAASRIRESAPDARFLLAGDGPLLESMQTMAYELRLQGRAFFLGRCPHIAELLHVSDVCVLTSSSEGFSNSVL